MKYRRNRLVFAFLAFGAYSAFAPAQTASERETSRIVSVGGAITEIVYALGAEKQLVAVDTTSLYPEAAQRLPKVGYSRQLSAEGVLSMRPTLVLATSEAGPPTVLTQLRDARVNLEVVSADYSVDELRRKLRAVSKAVGKKGDGRALEQKIVRELDELASWVAKQSTQPRVLFILSHSGSPQVSGGDTAADALIKLAGGVNVMSGFKGYRPLTIEAAIAAAPDVILTTTQGLTAIGGVEKMLAQPGLALTPAGKAKRVVDLEALYLLGFGPRLPQAVRETAERIRADHVAQVSR